MAKGEGKGEGVKCVSENVHKEVIFFTVASLIGNKIAVDGILNVIVIEYNFVLSLSKDSIQLHLILMEDMEIFFSIYQSFNYHRILQTRK